MTIGEISQKGTAKTTPHAVMALGALLLITGYMSAMAIFNPSNTVFKSQFGIEGEKFTTLMFFAAFLSFAAFSLSILTQDSKKNSHTGNVVSPAFTASKDPAVVPKPKPSLVVPEAPVAPAVTNQLSKLDVVRYVLKHLNH